MRRYLIPLIFGFGGFAVLVSFGVWQLQRLEWKRGVLAAIEARIGDTPVVVPRASDPEKDRYMPVRAIGGFEGNSVRVLVSAKGRGAGYRIVSTFRLADGRLILVDEGFAGLEAELDSATAENVTVIGNLHWPDEVDGWTPEPDLAQGLFYARDVDQMAETLGTEPLLIVARTVSGTDRGTTPMPVTTEGIPNDHLGYAIQWFGLAAVWLGMTAFLLWRIRKRTV